MTLYSPSPSNGKRKLLVLDVNGVLGNVLRLPPKWRGGLYEQKIVKRPFYDDFLEFCFQNFDVGVWSSRTKENLNKFVDELFGDLRKKLLFCWDMSHCTKTESRSLENKNKPIFFKELTKVWENDDPNLPWKKEDYESSNTLLVDDSPYKALLNPLHTAIFPKSYQHEDENDNSLGPGGDLRVYLEGVLRCKNVQEYVEQHHFGQDPVDHLHPFWGYYNRVIEKEMKKRSQ